MDESLSVKMNELTKLEKALDTLSDEWKRVSSDISELRLREEAIREDFSNLLFSISSLKREIRQMEGHDD